MNKLHILSGIAILALVTTIVLVNVLTKTNLKPAVKGITAPEIANKCIIIIDGSSYDVTVFKNMHSGGDVFNCGTDMSQIFWQKHGQQMLDFMQRYKL